MSEKQTLARETRAGGGAGLGPDPTRQEAPVKQPSEGTMAPLMRYSIQRAVIALSAATVILVRIWTELLLAPTRVLYTAKFVPRSAYVAVLTDILLAAILIYALLILAERPNSILSKSAQVLVVLLAIIPVAGFHELYRQRVTSMINSSMGRYSSEFPVVAIGVALALLIGGLVFMRYALYRMVRRGFAILFPLVIMVCAQDLAAYWTYNAEAFANRPVAPLLGSRATGPRLVWMIFDELDANPSIAGRPADLHLPALDGLLRESFSATEAYSPDNRTIRSIPSLTTGQCVAEVTEVSNHDLMLKFAGSGRANAWSQEPTVFSRARTLGYDTAVVGWYHPYCRVLSSQVASCDWFPLATEANSRGATWPELVPGNARGLFETIRFSPFGWSLTMQHAVSIYQQHFREALRIVADPRYRFLYMHFPIPHGPFIYDRRTSALDSAGAGTYVDNVALVDRTLHDLRARLEAAGAWDDTTIVLSADHGNRKNQDVRGTNLHVPFVVKLAHQNQPIVFEPQISTLVTHDLILAVLSGEIARAAQLPDWMSQHSPHLGSHGCPAN